jgi:hypothetical protein
MSAKFHTHSDERHLRVFVWILTSCAVVAVAGCQAPRPTQKDPKEPQLPGAQRRAATLTDIQRMLSEAEFALAGHRYEAAVADAEKIWKSIPDPSSYHGSVADYKALTDVAARCGEIPIHAWRRRGDFVNERKAVESCAKRYELAEAYSNKILAEVEAITRDAEMLKGLREYRSPQETEFRAWHRQLTTAAAVAEVLSRSGHNRSAIGVLREFRTQVEGQLADGDTRWRLLDQWNRTWDRLGFEEIIANAMTPMTEER